MIGAFLSVVVPAFAFGFAAGMFVCARIWRASLRRIARRTATPPIVPYTLWINRDHWFDDPHHKTT